MNPRYSDKPLPPYSHVPGLTPHPISDPKGHMHGKEETVPDPMDARTWPGSPEYLFALDLFNQGFYWEAHEAWEQLWIAADRSGPVADFLKGLIKLAAAGVKLREGNPEGVLRHGRRAEELLGQGTACGFDREHLLHLALEVQAFAGKVPETPDAERLLPVRLELQERG